MAYYEGSDELSLIEEAEADSSLISNDSDGWEVIYNDFYGMNLVLTATEIDLATDPDHGDFNLLEEAKSNTDPEDPAPNNQDLLLMNTTTNTTSTMDSGTLDIEIGEESSTTLLVVFVFSTSIVVAALVLYSVRRYLSKYFASDHLRRMKKSLGVLSVDISESLINYV